MNFGFENGRFYISYAGCARPAGTLRQEAQARAREIYQQNPQVMLCLSSGLDSQIALHSFMSQGIPIECAFLRMGGFNENEYENVKTLEKKWGFRAHVIDINPNEVREELDHLRDKLQAHSNHCLQHMFVRQLPAEHSIVQVLHDPWTITSRKLNQHFLFHGFYDPEIARYRALKAVERSGDIHMFGDSHEFFLSCISDPLFDNFFNSWIYYDGNGLMQYERKLPDVLRYEYYIKPMLYAKHWADELVYFPKFSGYENIDWLMREVRVLQRERMVLIERNRLIRHLSTIGAPETKFFEVSDEIARLLKS